MNIVNRMKKRIQARRERTIGGLFIDREYRKKLLEWKARRRGPAGIVGHVLA